MFSDKYPKKITNSGEAFKTNLFNLLQVGGASSVACWQRVAIQLVSDDNKENKRRVFFSVFF